MRLINADALKEEISNNPLIDFTDDDIFTIIDNLPTVARTEKPFVCIDGMIAYITQGHIDALIEYEKKQATKEIVDDLMKTFDDVRELNIKPNCINCVHHIDDVCEHCYETNVNWCTGYRSAGDK